jgi:hypothetical protein
MRKRDEWEYLRGEGGGYRKRDKATARTPCGVQGDGSSWHARVPCVVSRRLHMCVSRVPCVLNVEFSESKFSSMRPGMSCSTVVFYAAFECMPVAFKVSLPGLFIFCPGFICPVDPFYSR